MIALRKPSPFAWLRWLINRRRTQKLDPYLETCFVEFETGFMFSLRIEDGFVGKASDALRIKDTTAGCPASTDIEP